MDKKTSRGRPPKKSHPGPGRGHTADYISAEKKESIAAAFEGKKVPYFISPW